MSDAATRAEAGTILRSLIDKIILTPREGEKGLSVDLVGDLAGILSIATKSGRLAVESELSKLQPVNEAEHLDSAESEGDDLAIAGSMAMVAGGRLLHESKEAQVRRNIRETWASVVVDAGTGFEPVTFRL